MATEQRLVPINQVYRYTKRVMFDVSLPPFLERDRIGVNLRRTLGLMTLGGIRSLRMTQETDEDNSVSMPTIVGINPDGSALAGKVKAARKALYHSEQHQQRENLPIQNIVWTDLRIRLSIDQVQKEIAGESKNLRQPDSWTPYLDTVLRESIRKGGTHHLLKGHDVDRALCAFCINGTFLSLGILAGFYGPALVGYVGLTAGGLLLELLNNKTGVDGYGIRASIIPGYEIDRAFLLQTLSRTMHLVESIKQETLLGQSPRNP